MRNNVICLGDIPTPKGYRNKQGYMIYDINGISISITAQTGGLGGSSGLYIIKDKNKKYK